MSFNKKKAIKHLNIGNQKLQSGDLYSAIDEYKKTIKLAPTLSEGHHNIGVAYYKLGMTLEAEAALKKHITLDKNSSAGHYLYAFILYRHGKIDTALASYKRAYKLDPSNLDAVAGIAQIYNYKKDYAEAYKSIKSILSDNKANIKIAQVFSKFCDKIELCDQAIKYIEYITGPTSNLPLSIKNTAYFSLGSILDKRGAYDEAFRAYEVANNSQPLKYNGAVFDAFEARIKSIHSAENLKLSNKSTYNTSKPVFLIGMPRSGTSLLEQILSSHSDVYGTGESNEIRNIVQSISKGNDLSYPQCTLDLSIEELDKHSHAYVKNQEHEAFGEKLIIDKMPHNFFHLGLISQLFPNCKVIHCTRSPLDTCLSIYFQSFNETHQYASNLKNLAHHYKFYQNMMAHWKKALPINILEISYEDTVSNLKGTTEKLLQHLELEWEDDCMSFYDTKRHVFTASQEQVDKPIYTSSSGRWKNYEQHIQLLINEFN